MPDDKVKLEIDSLTPESFDVTEEGKVSIRSEDLKRILENKVGDNAANSLAHVRVAVDVG